MLYFLPDSFMTETNNGQKVSQDVSNPENFI